MLGMNLSIQKICMMMLSFLDLSLAENEVTRAHLQMFSVLFLQFYFLRSQYFRFSLTSPQTFFRLQRYNNSRLSLTAGTHAGKLH